MFESEVEALCHLRFFSHDYDAVEEFLQNEWVLPILFPEQTPRFFRATSS